MNRFLTMKRLSLMFVVLFGLSVSGMLAYQHFRIDPERKCEKSGQWWFAEENRCLTPLYLPDITGRPEGVSRAEASNEQNRELLEIEARLAQEKAARDAFIARERASVAGKAMIAAALGRCASWAMC